VKLKKGVSLLELLVVVIIIGILATLSLPLFSKTRERALDNEAKANLKLIQAAQRIYAMEVGFFLDCSGYGGINCINTYLKLTLPAGVKRSWGYNTTAPTASSFIATAIRNTIDDKWLRTWSIDEDDEEPSCSGSGCP
jgi:prepilin-type N-terminal cleavage/methylation domain-containing protein